ncbi:hypothetical protein [Streptomyces sp. JH34]|uniref:hypothetical protein n=2 Tax=unclassified Streptomyces TaxID=2593676 RepID=UPI003211F777
MSVNTGRMWKWLPVAVGVNVLLGVPGVVPVWLLWYYASNGPLASMGWTSREPTENDGLFFWLVAAVVVNAVFLLVWWFANRPVRRRMALDPLVYWPAGALIALVPTFILMLVL